MHVCQPAVQYSAMCMQCKYGAVQFERTGLHGKSKMSLLGIDACFESQNDAVPKILHTHTQTNILTTVTLCTSLACVFMGPSFWCPLRVNNQSGLMKLCVGYDYLAKTLGLFGGALAAWLSKVPI